MGSIDDLVPDDVVNTVSNISVDDLVTDDVVDLVNNTSLDDIVSTVLGDDDDDNGRRLFSSVDDIIDVVNSVTNYTAKCKITYVYKSCFASSLNCSYYTQQVL